VLRRRRRGLRVRQKIRRVELWPLAKLALAFHAICGAISLGVLVVLWNLASRADVPDRLTSFLVDIGFADTVEITGERLFRGATTIVIALVLHNTIVTILLGVLYNLLSGILGGLMMSVVQDDTPKQRRGLRVGRNAGAPDAKKASSRGPGRQPRKKSERAASPMPADPDMTAVIPRGDSADIPTSATAAPIADAGATGVVQQPTASVTRIGDRPDTFFDDQDDTDWTLFVEDELPESRRA
jgi:hypothetical protein